jgi:hypothetical protein
MYNALVMTRASAELLLLAALLAGVWMVLGRGAPDPDASRVPERRVPERRDPVGDGLGERTERLRAYISESRGQVAVHRNPFSFPAPARPAPPDASPERRVEVDSEAGTPRPELTLSGIAEDQVAGTIVRTAIINAAGQLVFAKEGDRVLTRFLIVRIVADAVQVKDTERDEVFTVAFK